MARIITVTSGAAGVGKTSICVNLAAQLARRGERVCLLDADGQGTNVSVALGLEPRHTLEDLVLSDVALEDVLVRNCLGFDILPGSARGDWLDVLTADQLQCLANAIRQLNGYDLVLIDCPPGTTHSGLAFALASAELLLVITAQPESHDAAYALLKRLHAEHADARIHVVLNQARNHTLGSLSYDEFQEVAGFYLGVQLPLLGLVDEDDAVRRAVGQPQALVEQDSETAAARDVAGLAHGLLVGRTVSAGEGAQNFCERYLDRFEAADSAPNKVADVLPLPVSGRQKLQQQLEQLSDRVNALIGEIERLRSDGSESAALSPASGGAQHSEDPSLTEEHIAVLANGCEAVTVQGDSFSIYSRRTSSGAQQHFAWHSADDCLEASQPHTGC
jgi:flagellar biosynthesis protein FlhG